MSKVKFKASITGTTTDAIINLLNMVGFFAWRNNTAGVWNVERQQFIKNKRIKKGVADILGVDWNGRSIAIEVKIGNDRLSVDQTLFAVECIARGVVYMIAGHIDDVVKSLRYYNYDINDNGYMRSVAPVSLKDRILDYDELDNIPNANKLKKLRHEEIQTLSGIATGGMAKLKLKQILGHYTERVM